MRRTLTTVLTTATLALTSGVAGATIVSYTSPADPANPTAMRGCVIRFDTLSSSGNSVVPRIHANSTHHCVGVTDVRADWSPSTRGDLIVENTGGPTVVVTVSVDPDETLTARGIACGASGGGDVTRIRCYDRDGNKVEAQSLDMYGPTANLWIGFTMWMPEGAPEPTSAEVTPRTDPAPTAEPAARCVSDRSAKWHRKRKARVRVVTRARYCNGALTTKARVKKVKVRRGGR